MNETELFLALMERCPDVWKCIEEMKGETENKCKHIQ